MRKLRAMLTNRIALARAVPILFLSACASAQGDSFSAAAYFPPTEFHDVEAPDASVPAAWAEYLSAFDEPSFIRDRSLKFAVRLTIAPSSQGGVVIRISKKKDGTIVGVKKEIVIGTTMPVTSSFPAVPSDLTTIKKALERENFWRSGNRQSIATSDGQSWLIEVSDQQGFHAVYSDGPAKGAVRSIGRLLMTIAQTNAGKR